MYLKPIEQGQGQNKYGINASSRLLMTQFCYPSNKNDPTFAESGCNN